MPALRPGVWGKKSFRRGKIPQDVVYHEHDNKVQLLPLFPEVGARKNISIVKVERFIFRLKRFEGRDGSGGWTSGTKVR